MDQVYVVRHRVLVQGCSQRRVARELGISRVTVKRYVEGAEPGVRRAVPRARPVADAVRERVEAILGDSKHWTGGKQRLTAKRLRRMLREEGKHAGKTVVQELVADWRRRHQEVFIPLAYKPGDLAEVDFFEVLVDVAGERRKAQLFVMRLMYSGRDFAWLYDRADQVSFLDGHVRAFSHFGCVPHRSVYDNLKAAVRKILVGSERELAARFLALTTHYVFEASFARPATGHDKGGVEARGKGIRWQELVPIPSGETLGEISAALLARLDARVTEPRGEGVGPTIGALFADERVRMLPLPATPFRAAAHHVVGLSRRRTLRVEGARYSCPEDWADLEVAVFVGATEVEIAGRAGRVVHDRQPHGGESIDYRHYLRELSRKPQAVRQVADRLIDQLGAPFDALWRLLVDQHGPKRAARVFAQVLAAVRERGQDVVAERVREALATGSHVLLLLRAPDPPPATVPDEQLPAALVGLDVAAGCAADYDVLLGGGR